MGFLSDFMSGLTERFGPMAPLLGVGVLGLLLILLALPVVMKRQRDRFRELKEQGPKTPTEKKRALRKVEKVDKLERFATSWNPRRRKSCRRQAEDAAGRLFRQERSPDVPRHPVPHGDPIPDRRPRLCADQILSQEISGTDMMLYTLLPLRHRLLPAALWGQQARRTAPDRDRPGLPRRALT